MKNLFLIVVLALVCAPLCAQEKPDAASSMWLQRDSISLDELLLALDAKPSPATRARLGEALAKRNASIERANEELRAALRAELQQNDAQINARAQTQSDAARDAARLERIRRLQPSRYQAIKRQQQRDANAARKKAETTK